jgi:hypothetical protein
MSINPQADDDVFTLHLQITDTERRYLKAALDAEVERVESVCERYKLGRRLASAVDLSQAPANMPASVYASLREKSRQIQNLRRKIVHAMI